MSYPAFAEERLNKRAALAKSHNVYPSVYARTHVLDALQQTYQDLEPGKKTTDTACVAGRIMALRNSGMFLDIKDQTGRLQLFCHQDALDDASQALLQDLDLGDWIGAEGIMRKTPRGEVTLDAQKLTILSKALYPLPDKRHGLTDPETRYRMRYVDFMVTPEANDALRKRAGVISSIRSILGDKGFLEVETPMLHPIAGGALAKPFVTHHNALHTDLYLRIAPELYLKRLVVGGFEKVFELGRCFRNEGLSPRHNPEFTSLEVYEAFVDYTACMVLTEQLVAGAAQHVARGTALPYGESTLEFKTPWPRKTMAELVREQTDVDFMALTSDDEAHAAAKKLGHPLPAHYGWGEILAALFEEYVEHTLLQPIHVTGFPKSISPLAKGDSKDPRLAERFESYANGWEIANGFSELNDPSEQYARFEEQLKNAARGDDEAHAMDHDYIRALGYGLPPTGGFGIGIDRIVMLLTNMSSIREVLAFPTLRPKGVPAKEQPA